MNLSHINTIYANSQKYPRKLTTLLGTSAPNETYTIGNQNIISHPIIALFCSSSCPGSIILKTFDLAQKIGENRRTVVGGFHSPIERECFNILIRSECSLIVVPARGLNTMRLPKAWAPALKSGRLLILSPFAGSIKRASEKNASERNKFVSAIADLVIIAHCAKGSRLTTLIASIVAWNKPLYTIDDPENRNLIEAGAKIIPSGLEQMRLEFQ